VTAYEVAETALVGVPLMRQVELLMERPSGSSGEIEQLVIGAPPPEIAEGDTDIATPTVPKVPAELAKLKLGVPDGFTRRVTDAHPLVRSLQS
jgi:hypothetical protein